jgi:chitosanase
MKFTRSVFILFIIGNSIFASTSSLSRAAAKLELRQAPVVSDRQRLTIDEVVSAFENGTAEMNYEYVAALGDGRGYTAGRAGFTTGTGDLVVVVRRYLQRVNNPGLKALMPILTERAALESPSIQGLEALPGLWKMASMDPIFRKVQDEVSNELYFEPAENEYRKFGFHTPLALLCLYDTIIQHGDDGLDDILEKLDSNLVIEDERLINFLEIRREALLNPEDEATAEVWRESVGRVDALRKMIKDRNFQLTVPTIVNPFGTEILIP